MCPIKKHPSSERVERIPELEIGGKGEMGDGDGSKLYFPEVCFQVSCRSGEQDSGKHRRGQKRCEGDEYQGMMTVLESCLEDNHSGTFQERRG